MVDTQHFCLRWNNYQSSITSAFENLRDDEDFVDVTLACDGKSLKAHRVVLSACSPFFRELLKSTPCKHPVIVLQDVAWTDLHALVEFIYHGEVNVHQRSLSSFLKTAEVLRVSGLTQQHVDDRDQLSQVQSMVRSNHHHSSSNNNTTTTTTATSHHPHQHSSNSQHPLLHSPSPLTPPITNHHHGGAFPGDKMDEDRASNSNHLFGGAGDSSPPLGGSHTPTQLSHLTSTTTHPATATLPHPTTTPTPPHHHQHHHHHHTHHNNLLSSSSQSATVNQLLRRAALQHRRDRRSISSSSNHNSDHGGGGGGCGGGGGGGGNMMLMGEQSMLLSEHHKRARAAAEHLLGAAAAAAAAAAANNNNVDMVGGVQTQPTDFSPSGKGLGALLGRVDSMQLLKELSKGGDPTGAAHKSNAEGNGISSTDGNGTIASSPSPTGHLHTNHIQSSTTPTSNAQNTPTSETPSSTAGAHNNNNNNNNAATSSTTTPGGTSIKTEPMDLLCGSSSSDRDRERDLRGLNHMDDVDSDEEREGQGGGSRGTTPGPPEHHRSSSHLSNLHHSHHSHHHHHHSSPPTPTSNATTTNHHLPHHLSLHSSSGGGQRQLLPPGPHSGGSSVGGDDLHHDGLMGGGHDGVPPYLSADSKLFAAAAGAGSFNFSMAALAADPTGLGVLFLPGLNQSLQANADSLAGTSQGALGGSNIAQHPASPISQHPVRMPPPTQGGINEPQECPYCRRTFSCYYSLKRHFQDKHEQSDTLYVCEFCHRRYRTKNSLTTHKSLQHRGSSGMLKRLLKTTAIKSVLGAAAAASGGGGGGGGGGGLG